MKLPKDQQQMSDDNEGAVNSTITWHVSYLSQSSLVIINWKKNIRVLRFLRLVRPQLQVVAILYSPQQGEGCHCDPHTLSVDVTHHACLRPHHMSDQGHTESFVKQNILPGLPPSIEWISLAFSRSSMEHHKVPYRPIQPAFNNTS